MLTLRLGLSTCVATMDTPAPCFHFAGIVNATSELWFLGACQYLPAKHPKARVSTS